MVKRTFQPHKRSRKRKHGYLRRNKKVLANRRRKGRRRLAV